MPTVVPESPAGHGQEGLAAVLEEALDGLLEFTGAAAGCVGVLGPDGRLSFPAYRGSLPESWLPWQLGQQGVWGFAVREGPTLLNDLPARLALGEPPLRNLLSAPILDGGTTIGHVLLANKPAGFTSHDATALQLAAHLMARQMIARRPAADSPPSLPAALLRLALDRVGDGVLVVDDAGALLYANAAWAEWTGFTLDELLRTKPRPDWIGHRQLASLTALETVPSAAPAQPVLLPFRRRDDSLLWCQVERLAQECEGRRLTVAFLKPAPPPRSGLDSRVSAQPTLPTALAESLPFGLAVIDHHGRVVWANGILAQLAAGSGPRPALIGQALRDRLDPAVAPGLDRLLRDLPATGPGCAGRLPIQFRDCADELMAYWFAVPLPDGPGLMLAVSEDWEALFSPEDLAAEWRRWLRRPAADWLALLYQPGRGVLWWDDRWEKLTGLTARPQSGESNGNWLLDQLFPRQRERELVADLLHPAGRRSPRRGAQAVLEVLTPAGGRRMFCTFLPVSGMPSATGAGLQAGGEAWLVLIGEPELSVGEAGPLGRVVRWFAGGLAHLLNAYLEAPIDLAEAALDRPDLPAELRGWFERIKESNRGASALVTALHHLALDEAENTELVSLAVLVREFLQEQAAAGPPKEYELATELDEPETPVRVNPRLLRVALEEIFRNAEHAVLGRSGARIAVRVLASEDSVSCEIADNGEGFPAAEWSVAPVPFASTKGPFARDPRLKALPANGLGLLVCRHLLALHGGKLEVRSAPGAGAAVTLVLPRGQQVPAETAGTPAALRADPLAGARGPHLKTARKPAPDSGEA